jgi:hypothetical protein
MRAERGNTNWLAGAVVIAALLSPLLACTRLLDATDFTKGDGVASAGDGGDAAAESGFDAGRVRGIACGGGAACAAGKACCAVGELTQATWNDSTCEASRTACTAASRPAILECDDAADCPTDTICCGYATGGILGGTVCDTRCAGADSVTFCDPARAADCAQGETCTPVRFAGGLTWLFACKP